MSTNPGNTFESAPLVNISNVLREFENNLGPNNRSDWFKFRTNRNRSFFYADLYNLQANVDLVLFNRNRQVVARSIRKGTQVELIRLGANDDLSPRRPPLPPGVYYMRVFTRGRRPTSYTLRMASARAPRTIDDPEPPPNGGGGGTGGQNSVLVRDINSGELSGLAFRTDFAVLNGDLYFSADDGRNGRELWRSNGTSVGTQLVADINRGAESSNPSNLTVFNDLIYFSADDGTGEGIELWRTDGTRNGTRLVADINRGQGSSSPSNFAVVGDSLYFVADDGRTGRELWRVTENDQTSQVADINRGTGSSSPNWLVAFDDALYFAASDGRDGLELWRSNGTIAGTVQVADLNPREASSSPSELTVVGDDRLYFAADDGRSGRELWFLDRVSNSNRPVLAVDLNRGQVGSNPTDLIEFDNRLYFAADDGRSGRELWRSDGTTISTRLVSNINTNFDEGSSPAQFAVVNDRLYFAADAGRGDGRELWRSDGTASGTTQVDNIGRDQGSNPSSLIGIDDVLYFVANDGIRGLELWRFDT